MENDNKLRLTIKHDTDPEDPRTAFDNMGTMVCWSRIGVLGDEQVSPDEYNTPAEYRDAHIEDDAVVLALYMSGQQDELTCGTELSETFIGRQIGFIYIEVDKIREEYERNTQSTRESALAYLKGEVAQYNQWMTGDVWGFELEQGTTCKCCDHTSYKHVDSSWGFYGSIDGMAERLGDDAKALLPGAWEDRS